MEMIQNPRIMKYGFKIFDRKKFHEAILWCEKNLGRKNKEKTWTSRGRFWYTSKAIYGHGAIYLDTLDDALQFKLIHS